MVDAEKSFPYPLEILGSAIQREMVPGKAPAAPLKVSVEIQRSIVSVMHVLTIVWCQESINLLFSLIFK